MALFVLSFPRFFREKNSLTIDSKFFASIRESFGLKQKYMQLKIIGAEMTKSFENKLY